MKLQTAYLFLYPQSFFHPYGWAAAWNQADHVLPSPFRSSCFSNHPWSSLPFAHPKSDWPPVLVFHKTSQTIPGLTAIHSNIHHFIFLMFNEIGSSGLFSYAVQANLMGPACCFVEICAKNRFEWYWWKSLSPFLSIFLFKQVNANNVSVCFSRLAVGLMTSVICKF